MPGVNVAGVPASVTTARGEISTQYFGDTIAGRSGAGGPRHRVRHSAAWTLTVPGMPPCVAKTGSSYSTVETQVHCVQDPIGAPSTDWWTCCRISGELASLSRLRLVTTASPVNSTLDGIYTVGYSISAICCLLFADKTRSGSLSEFEPGEFREMERCTAVTWPCAT